MLRKISPILIAIIFALAAIPLGQTAEASTTYTFVNVTYNEIELKDGTVEKTLSKVTLQNSAGKTSTFNIDSSARLYINNTLTTINGFKAGMQVTVSLNLRKVKEMRGTSDVEQGEITTNSKQKAGVVTQIDANGMFVKVKVDKGRDTTYYINNNTEFIKGSSTVDLSALYEGDRVKLKFSSTSTSIPSEIEIIATGVLVENLYKATLQTVNTTSNKFTVKNAHPFTNWLFGERVITDINTFGFSNSTSIYVGNKKITKNQLKNYKNSEIYYVSLKQFSKEVVTKIIVLAKNERSFYQSLSEVNTKYGYFKLANLKNNFYYHDGSILVRNGRLVEPTSLASKGTAYILTDGNTSSQFAHVVNITNDSFTSPNLSSHKLYFGQIYLADLEAYRVELDGLEIFENNFWKSYKGDPVFSFSNSTNAVVVDGSKPFKIFPETELVANEGDYGYFYVKDGHIQAMHIMLDEPRTELTLTGRIDKVGNNSIDVKDVSQWINGGEWSYFGETKVELTKVMIIKNGKVIQPNELKRSDRVVMLMNSELETHVILVNE
ncbi:phosphate ABC transporter ATPase [Solibacillus sp. FSL H8-0538]|uniref:phosphate ABC transporter ATPase n=1 Tax=Solibacillus sp. FSL H8-0538 TaxID=2921400 RepID=UPI0030FC149B